MIERRYDIGRPQRKKTIRPNEQTFEAWEDMRNEVWHELQDGASADVPESLIDIIGNLVVALDYWRADLKSTTRLTQHA